MASCHISEPKIHNTAPPWICVKPHKCWTSSKASISYFLLKFYSGWVTRTSLPLRATGIYTKLSTCCIPTLLLLLASARHRRHLQYWILVVFSRLLLAMLRGYPSAVWQAPWWASRGTWLCRTDAVSSRCYRTTHSQAVRKKQSMTRMRNANVDTRA